MPTVSMPSLVIFRCYDVHERLFNDRRSGRDARRICSQKSSSPLHEGVALPTPMSSSEQIRALSEQSDLSTPSGRPHSHRGMRPLLSRLDSHVYEVQPRDGRADLIVLVLAVNAPAPSPDSSLPNMPHSTLRDAPTHSHFSQSVPVPHPARHHPNIIILIEAHLPQVPRPATFTPDSSAKRPGVRRRGSETHRSDSFRACAVQQPASP